MKTNNRIIRINDEILKEISIIIRSEIKDPRLTPITSVVSVDTTADLKYCKVFVSVLGHEKQKKDSIDALKSSAGFIRKQIAGRINLRNTPELKFILDDSLEHGMKIAKLIEEVNKPLREQE